MPGCGPEKNPPSAQCPRRTRDSVPWRSSFGRRKQGCPSRALFLESPAAISENLRLGIWQPLRQWTQEAALSKASLGAMPPFPKSFVSRSGGYRRVINLFVSFIVVAIKPGFDLNQLRFWLRLHFIRTPMCFLHGIIGGGSMPAIILFRCFGYGRDVRLMAR